ncbi:unnamed protein product, partial [Pylaiella littoralis]
NKGGGIIWHVVYCCTAAVVVAVVVVGVVLLQCWLVWCCTPEKYDTLRSVYYTVSDERISDFDMPGIYCIMLTDSCSVPSHPLTHTAAAVSGVCLSSCPYLSAAGMLLNSQ